MRIPHPRFPILAAALAAASLAAPQASTTTRANGSASALPGVDSSRSAPYRDSASGGTGFGTAHGRGGSSLDSSRGSDTLWSSPYDSPATPGTGLPNSPGAGWPGTGGAGSPGNGGTGVGGSGMGIDTLGPAPAAPRNPAAPSDSIGGSDWMERG